jgi:hypothetical protein
MAAAFVVSRIGRRTRADSTHNFGDQPEQASTYQQVRAVPRPDIGVRVTTQEPGQDFTHVVRLEPHNDTAAVNVQEIRK